LHSDYVTHTRVSLLNWLFSFFFSNISLTLSCLFPLKASPFSVLPETNKLNQEIQLAEFKPIPTARKYMAETTNQ
jgi:hypothetical protein